MEGGIEENIPTHPECSAATWAEFRHFAFSNVHHRRKMSSSISSFFASFMSTVHNDSEEKPEGKTEAQVEVEPEEEAEEPEDVRVVLSP